ncbi:MAG: hypothetical protein AAFX06_05710 [Planctomycetota bacterium]
MKKCLVVMVVLTGALSLGCGRPDTKMIEQEQGQTQADLEAYEAQMNPKSGNK